MNKDQLEEIFLILEAPETFYKSVGVSGIHGLIELLGSITEARNLQALNSPDDVELVKSRVQHILKGLTKGEWSVNDVAAAAYMQYLANLGSPFTLEIATILEDVPELPFAGTLARKTIKEFAENDPLTLAKTECPAIVEVDLAGSPMFNPISRDFTAYRTIRSVPDRIEYTYVDRLFGVSESYGFLGFNSLLTSTSSLEETDLERFYVPS